MVEYKPVEPPKVKDFTPAENAFFGGIVWLLAIGMACVWIIAIGWVWRHIVVPLFSYWS